MPKFAQRWSVKGRPSDAVLAEVRRTHILQNHMTAIYRQADEEIAAVYDGVPDIAAAQQKTEEAKQAADELRAAINERKRRNRTSRADPDLAARLAGARQQYASAREALAAAKGANREATAGPVAAAAEKAAAAVLALYEPAVVSGALYEDSPVPGTLYWASFNAVARKMATAMKQVIKLRSQHKPAELKFHSWDGSGTIAVTLQRSAGGVTPEIRALIAELHEAGMLPGKISAELAGGGCELSPRSVGRVISAIDKGRPARPAGRADPRRSPELLASGAGKWRNVLQVRPGDGKYGEIAFRISSGTETLRIFISRPIPPEADVTGMELTVRQVPSAYLGGKPYYKASVSLIFELPPKPELPPGRPAIAVHSGWRVLEDGSIRVAVIAGASPPPPGICAAHKNPADGQQEYGVRDHGTWQEIVLPAGRRSLTARARSLQGIRDRHMGDARAAIAAHLARHPEHKQLIDPDGTLDRWKSPRRFTRVLHASAAAASEGTPDLAGLIENLRQWQERELHLAPWQYGEQTRHVIGWRRDTYRKIATWLAAQAGTIILDSWPAVRTLPGKDEEDTAQMKAARQNAALASPGELRLFIRSAARRENVPDKDGPAGTGGVHHGCGGELPADERAAGIEVICRRCGKQVDQDRNVLAAMLASTRENS